jgi:hypothetical protein
MTVQETTTQSAASKARGKKKRKISKHVLQAQEERIMKQQQPPPPSDGGEVTTVVPPPEEMQKANTKASNNKASTSAPKKKKNKKNVKDPNEAANYLTQWKRHSSGDESIWKFNKNTQSWLIRHMYEADKLSKSAFTLLLEYLNGLKGGDAKSRILAEATRRAIRYKAYEKIRDTQAEKEESADKDADADEKGETSTTTTTAQPDLTEQEQEEEEARWSKLNDHDKRNEYKRSRKVLDGLKDSVDAPKES